MTFKETIPGVKTKKHFFNLPVDYRSDDFQRLTIFARELVASEAEFEQLPYLVFFQGGPGFSAPRPNDNEGWIKRALKEYRVLLIDPRGTGLSSPINADSLSHLTDDEKVNYLSCFRADAIVRDAEEIRQLICANNKWSILGQSFGGFCVLQYLGDFPDSLSAAYITGGIPLLDGHADDVYHATYQRVIEKNKAFFSRFEDAQDLLTELADYVNSNEVFLPSGERLTVEMLQLIGINLGLQHGAADVYYLIEQAIIKTPFGKKINPYFLEKFSQLIDYNSNPIFSILHEPIYSQEFATQWSAEKVRQKFPEFNYQPGKALMFTGEMIYPWMFEQFKQLIPFKEVANRLALKADWPKLYNIERLSNNEVPIAAAIYTEDMFVDKTLSLKTANRIPNLKYWLTSEYEHNGIRVDGESILDKLISLNKK
ncbi:alpha/beta fold hydrolase [Aliikangiella coralliicola]|uniref:Alpha/beta hydrolase n=1 Tax=Aliikangiella coralliicola TaxID=2592383 RepID=A0A545U8W6_9GAMM|nr:alpha/beta fold hydrolase [Aliikangiella coralliicola]TQV85912.1 alpha/beta hydrolase [Aliikangiella coralliicola]